MTPYWYKLRTFFQRHQKGPKLSTATPHAHLVSYRHRTVLADNFAMSIKKIKTLQLLYVCLAPGSS